MAIDPVCGMALEPKTASAGVLYPFFGLLLSPIIVGAAMILSSVSVIGNALRPRKVRLRLDCHTRRHDNRWIERRRIDP